MQRKALADNALHEHPSWHPTTRSLLTHLALAGLPFAVILPLASFRPAPRAHRLAFAPGYHEFFRFASLEIFPTHYSPTQLTVVHSHDYCLLSHGPCITANASQFGNYDITALHGRCPAAERFRTTTIFFSSRHFAAPENRT